MKVTNRERIISALGQARIEPYLAAAEDNRKHALALYRWSVELNAAVQETLGITEVFLRNAIDEQLQKWNTTEPSQCGDPSNSWLLSPPRPPLRGLTEGKRVSAIKRAKRSAQHRHTDHPRHNQLITHDDVLAHTMFGMWKDLLPNHAPNADPEKPENRNRLMLWTEAIEHAFPNADDSTGQKTYWHVAHLHELRNRVSHMDSLLNVDVLDHLNRAFTLVDSIDPVLASWLTGTSTVSEVFNKKPK